MSSADASGDDDAELVPPLISPADLVGYVRQVEAAAGISYPRDMRLVYAGLIVLARFFGHDWIDARILRKSPFLHPASTRSVDELKRQDRIVMLAEHLVNLQSIPGFPWCLDEIRTDSIETGLAKLIGAGMLRRFKIPFRFVKPSGRKGRDYDAEATVGSTVVPVEMKAKIEGQAPTPEAIANALKRARKQLPRDTSNLVFLRVPENWGETTDGAKAIVDGIIREFKNSGTLGVVVVHWEYWVPAPTDEEPAGGLRGTRRMVMASGRARADITALYDALRAEPPRPVIEWLPLDRLFP